MQARPARRVLHIGAVLALVASCSSPPPRPTYPDIRFTGRPPIVLDVARVEVQSAYQAPFKAPNVDHLFPVPPARALENWARDRLKPMGRTGRAVFTIRDASVTETELPMTTGLQGALTTQPAERYDLRLEATVQIIDDGGLEARTASVKSARSQSVLENITPNDRDKAWYEMTKEAMADFDQQMESEIRGNFGTFVGR
jgi:hypothetical protein